MLIIGCDFHTRYQQISMAREETAEMIVERRLDHASGEAQAFYRSLQSFEEPVRVGIEATGPIHWFERLLTELGHELWIGDSAKIRASEVRKQRTDERDASLILDLLLSKRFPKIWVPTPAERDLRQLLWHRHKLVCPRTMRVPHTPPLRVGVLKLPPGVALVKTRSGKTPPATKFVLGFPEFYGHHGNSFGLGTFSSALALVDFKNWSRRGILRPRAAP
jgi:hypothetical protein